MDVPMEYKLWKAKKLTEAEKVQMVEEAIMETGMDWITIEQQADGHASPTAVPDDAGSVIRVRDPPLLKNPQLQQAAPKPVAGRPETVL